MAHDPEQRSSTIPGPTSPLFAFFSLLILFPLMAASAQAIDLGMSPSTIVQGNLLPGSSFQGMTTISRISTAGDLPLRLAARGPAADWITLPETLSIPDGQRTAVLPFTVHVPFEASSGMISATITITIIPEAAEGLSTTLSLPFTLALTVIDEEVEHAKVTLATVMPFDRSYVIAYTVTNTGNVPAGPDALTIIVKDRYRQETFSEDTVALTALAPPFAKTSFTLCRMHDLPPGTYWVTLTFNGIITSSFPLVLEVPSPSPAASQESEQPLPALPPPTGSLGRQTVLIIAFLAALLLVGVVARLVPRQKRSRGQDHPLQRIGG